MNFEFENQTTGAHLIMTVDELTLMRAGFVNGQNKPFNVLVLNKMAEPQEITIDEVSYNMPGYSLLPLVSNQTYKFKNSKNVISWKFNREFYCIVDHDVEVGCVGFLFYGIHHPMFILLDSHDMKDLNTLEQLFMEDLLHKDRMQEEMLRTLLKRLIIKSTRLAKVQVIENKDFQEEKLDIIRQFNLFLEIHFKKEHEVSFYAKQLNKSPKTLTNVFRLFRHPPPSQLIHSRIILEAKRFLHYTRKSGKEIGYELGFENAAHFSRFFKLKTGQNVSDVRRNLLGSNPDSFTS